MDSVNNRQSGKDSRPGRIRGVLLAALLPTALFAGALGGMPTAMADDPPQTYTIKVNNGDKGFRCSAYNTSTGIASKWEPEQCTDGKVYVFDAEKMGSNTTLPIDLEAAKASGALLNDTPGTIGTAFDVVANYQVNQVRLLVKDLDTYGSDPQYKIPYRNTLSGPLTLTWENGVSQEVKPPMAYAQDVVIKALDIHNGGLVDGITVSMGALNPVSKNPALLLNSHPNQMGKLLYGNPYTINVVQDTFEGRPVNVGTVAQYEIKNFNADDRYGEVTHASIGVPQAVESIPVSFDPMHRGTIVGEGYLKKGTTTFEYNNWNAYGKVDIANAELLDAANQKVAATISANNERKCGDPGNAQDLDMCVSFTVTEDNSNKLADGNYTLRVPFVANSDHTYTNFSQDFTVKVRATKFSFGGEVQTEGRSLSGGGTVYVMQQNGNVPVSSQVSIEVDGSFGPVDVLPDLPIRLEVRSPGMKNKTIDLPAPEADIDDYLVELDPVSFTVAKPFATYRMGTGVSTAVLDYYGNASSGLKTVWLNNLQVSPDNYTLNGDICPSGTTPVGSCLFFTPNPTYLDSLGAGDYEFEVFVGNQGQPDTLSVKANITVIPHGNQLKGKIINYHTGEPVADASVDLYEADPLTYDKPVGFVYTDPSGGFTFEGVQDYAGKFYVIANKSKYYVEQSEDFAMNGDTVVDTLEMDPEIMTVVEDFPMNLTTDPAGSTAVVDANVGFVNEVYYLYPGDRIDDPRFFDMTDPTFRNFRQLPGAAYEIVDEGLDPNAHDKNITNPNHRLYKVTLNNDYLDTLDSGFHRFMVSTTLTTTSHVEAELNIRNARPQDLLHKAILNATDTHTGAAIANATGVFTPDPKNTVQTTDPDSLYEGDYTVLVSAPGYYSASTSFTVGMADAVVDIQLEPMYADVVKDLGTWKDKDPDATALIKHNLGELKSLTTDSGEEWLPKFKTATGLDLSGHDSLDSETSLALSAETLAKMAEGTYPLNAKFTNGDPVKLTLKVVHEKKSEGDSGKKKASMPPSGADAGMPIPLLPLLGMAAVAWFAWRRKHS